MYEPSRHITSFNVAGFQHWDGALVLSELKPGMQLTLVPEPDNPYDPNAVAILFQGVKLGFVPADKNALLAQLLHFGHTGPLQSLLCFHSCPHPLPFFTPESSFKI